MDNNTRPAEGQVHIYGLLDPRDGTLAYIGKTRSTLNRRVTQHMAAARMDRKKGKMNYRTTWLIMLDDLGLPPQPILIESVSGEAWMETEKFWIGYFRSLGAQLRNISQGGEGGIPEGWLAPAAFREYMGKATKGRKHRPESIELMRQRRRERTSNPKCTEEQKAKISAAHKGRKKPEGHGAKVSLAQKGKPKSQQEADAIRARFNDPEWKRRHREGCLRSHASGTRAPHPRKKQAS